MKGPFSLLLALRYLQPKRTFVSLITVISVVGVMLGITVLILVISVMRGFDQELRRTILEVNAHLYVTGPEGMKEWRALDAEIAAVPGVTGTAPFIQGPVIAEYEGRRLAPKIRGIDPEREQNIIDIKSLITQGEFNLTGESCVLGRDLAEELGVTVGGKLSIYSPGNIGNIIDALNKAEKDGTDKQSMDEIREMVVPADLTVTGIFESGRYQYDSEFILVPLFIGQELYGFEDGVHGISVRADDPYHAPMIKEKIYDFLPSPLVCNTWIDMNKVAFGAITTERNLMFFLLFFIVLVAAFGIMTTLITVTVQKTREIGVMKALGARTGQIIWIFLAQGMAVGILGNVAGLAAGMSLIRWRNEVKEWLSSALHISIFPPQIYQFRAIPAEIVVSDVAIICIGAFVICSLAALIPAYFAARLDPVKALRYE